MATIFERLVMCKAETTKGTDSTPVAANDSLRVQDAQLTINTKNVDRPSVKPTMGNLPHVISADASVQLQLTVELKGSGAAGTAPDFAPLIKACRMKETVVATTSVTYDPLTAMGANNESATIYFYQDGLLWKMLGAVGNLALTANPGEFPVATFTMQSKYTAPTVAAIPAGAAFDSSTPVVVSSTDLYKEGGLGGTAFNVGAFAMDFGNDVQEHLTLGNHEFSVANRAPTMTVTKDSLSTSAEWTDLLATTNVALYSQISGGAGNILTINAPKAVRQSVAVGARAEKVTRDVTFGLYESGSDDQIQLVYT